jgi:hypothetical protein
MIQAEHGAPTSAKAGLLSNVYVQAKRAVDTHWHQIADGEAKLNELVRRAYQVPEAIYNEIIARAPEPNVTWAMRK